MSQSKSSLKDLLVVEDADNNFDLCLSQMQSTQLDTSGRSAADAYFRLSQQPPSQQSSDDTVESGVHMKSQEKDRNHREQYPQADALDYAPQAGAPGYAPRAGAPGYTAKPGGKAYAPQACASGCAPQAGASGCAPQAGAPRYTAVPGGMAYTPKADTPEYTQQATEIVTQPRFAIYQQQPVPSDNLYLSICSCVCCVWPLGIVAIIYALMSQRSAERGDMVRAEAQGKTALNFSIISGLLGMAIIIGANVAAFVYQQRLKQSYNASSTISY